MKLTIVRHGATKNNEEGLNRGFLDIPLAPEGRDQAHKIGVKLRNKGIDGIFTSDLIRAVETGDIISKETGIPVLGKTFKLRPWDLGCLQGQDVLETLPILQDFMRNYPSTQLKDGECFNNFKKRALEGLQEIINLNPSKHYLIVTHHRDERLIHAWKSGGQKDDLSINVEEMMHKGAEPGTSVEIELEAQPLFMTPARIEALKTLKDIPQSFTRSLKRRIMSPSEDLDQETLQAIYDK